MGGLAGYNYRKLIKKIKKFGFSYYRQAKGSHEIWYNEETNKFTTIPNHPGDIPLGTMRAILNQAGIDEDDFQRI